ncbi:MAG: MucR family transcriptional regulator [Caulobacterales bacterium]
METKPDLAALAANIVAAYVRAHQVPSHELSSLIRSVYATLRELEGAPVAIHSDAAQEPAIAVKKSVTPEFIICLEDGKKFKSLKRHLRTRYGMTPEEYRAKWGLASDYPMVAPNYAKARSALAKRMGLGTARRN